MRLLRLAKFGVKYLQGGHVQGVGLILTRRCNLRCPYCGIIEGPGAKASAELDPARWKAIIDRFVKSGRLHFILTGGEPLMYPGWQEVLDHAASKALVSLITNATLLDEDRFARLRHLDYLTFSWDALGQSDAGLVKDPSERLPLIADCSRRYGITPSAIVTVTSQNLDDIEPICERLDAHGITALLSLIHSATPEAGFDFRGETPTLDFTSPADRERLGVLAVRLKARKHAGLRLAESDNFLDHMVDYVSGDYRLDCPAADHFFTVDVDGRIKACHDTPPSVISALDFDDYDRMRQAVRATVPPNCNCYYDCYFEARNSPLQVVTRALRRESRGLLRHLGVG